MPPRRRASEDGSVYFSIIDDRVSAGKRCKTMPGAGTSNLRVGDMAIAVYPVLPGSTANRPVISSQPVWDGAMTIQILRPLDLQKVILLQMTAWRRGRVEYSFKRDATAEFGRRVLTAMVAAEAYPGRGESIFQPRDGEEKELLQSWSHLGYVAQVTLGGDGWLLADMGTSMLESCIEVGLFVIHHLPCPRKGRLTRQFNHR